MNQTIKTRIEQIGRGEVPEGYKKTKAGIIPIEWEEKRIGEILTQRKMLVCVSEEAPLLSFTIEEGIIEPENKKSNKRDFLIKDMATKKFALTEVGDIIYNPANLKFGAIHRNNLRRGVVSPIYGIFYGTQNSLYIAYLLRNQRFIDYAKIYTEGTVEKLKTLKAETFLKLKITLPSRAEQEKIVEILGTQDKLIALKEKRIAEKKQQKKYLMQQLLTGKKRLPGFTGEWITIKLGKLAEIDTGNADTQDKVDGGVYPFYVRSATIEHIDSYSYDGEAILTPGDGKIGEIYHYVNGKFNFHQRVYKISDFKQCIGKFVFYYLSLFFKKRAMTMTAKATVDSIRREMLTDMLINLPELKEQQAIADILSKADKEIELLQKDLEEEKKKKKALMQLLLTGIVRVS